MAGDWRPMDVIVFNKTKDSINVNRIEPIDTTLKLSISQVLVPSQTNFSVRVKAKLPLQTGSHPLNFRLMDNHLDLTGIIETKVVVAESLH